MPIRAENKIYLFLARCFYMQPAGFYEELIFGTGSK